LVEFITGERFDPVCTPVWAPKAMLDELPDDMSALFVEPV
jgi:hypothetical protein